MKSRVNPRFYLADVVMPLDQESYVVRDADTEILEAIAAREYPLLLSSRKVGKSSLLIRTFDRLRAGEGLPDGERFFVAKQELAEANPRVAEESWYLGLVHALARSAETQNPGFEVPEEWHIWWKGQSILSPGRRFSAFLRKYFLEPTTQSWVIAIDEIDTVLQLPFSDDFFAAIRRMRGERASDPVFERLVFLLSGVTTPARLIKDNRRTPFNFGRNISLHDFTAEQACTLLRGLGEPEDAGHPALRAVLDWTGGHPYLTQTVFKALARHRAKEKSKEPPDWGSLVDHAVRESLLNTFGGASPDPQLQDIAERRIRYLSVPGTPNYDPDLKRRILTVYRRALRDAHVRDDALSPAIVELKVTGLLESDAENPGHLRIRNRLYRTVFDERWVAGEMPPQLRRSRITAAAMAAVLTLAGVYVQRHRDEAALIAKLKLDIAIADTDVPLSSYERLRKISGQETAAAEALAGYWKTKARRASVERPRDEAALFWLKALSIHEDADSRLQARRVLSGSLPQVMATFRHEDKVNYAAFSADGRFVITASDDKTAQMWEVESGQPVGQPLSHGGSVLYAEFSADGHRVLTCSDDGTARVWDTQSGQPVCQPVKHADRINSAAFSPDGRRIVTASEDRAQIWNTEDGQPVGAYMLHAFFIYNVAFSPDGRLVVTASSDKTAQVWDVERGLSLPVGLPLRHEGAVFHAEFSADGRRVVTASQDKTARVWDTQSGQPVGQPLRHEEAVQFATFGRDGERVVTASDDRTARVWDAQSGQPMSPPLRHGVGVSHAEFSADGRHVVTVSYNRVMLWDAQNGQPMGQPLLHEGQVYHAEFNTDGQRVVTAGFDKTARVWDAQSSQPMGQPLRHEGGIQSAEFSTDGQHVVAASADRTARVWDAQSGQPIGQPLQHEEAINHAAFSADGRRVVTAGDGRTARVWDARSGQPISPPLRHEDSVNYATFSTDGRSVVTASRDRTARVWDAQSGQPVSPPLQHEASVNHATFSTDGRRVVTASRDRTARVWDAQSGQPISPPLQHEDSVNHAAFSADGRRVVTAGFDKTARVWDAQSGQSMSQPLRHKDLVFYAEFSTDGQRVVTQMPGIPSWWHSGNDGAYTPLATVWANSGYSAGPSHRAEPDAAVISLLDFWTGDTLLIRHCPLFTPEARLPELPAAAAELLINYERRFSLVFQEEGAKPFLVPRATGRRASDREWPLIEPAITSPKEPSRSPTSLRDWEEFPGVPRDGRSEVPAR